MLEDLKSYYLDIRQDVIHRASSTCEFLESEFFSFAAEELVQSGVIDGFEVCPYKAVQGGVRVDGYWFNEGQRVLNLYIVDYANREDLQSLTKTDTINIVKRATKFFKLSLQGLHADLEETSPGYGLARYIYDNKNAFSRVEVYLISERSLSDRFDHIEDQAVDRWNIKYNIWDVSRLFRLASARGAREELVIDLGDDGLQCLPAHLPSDKYKSYLVVMPGQLLADLYSKYGSRLLEQNVRSFLQARGKVNKGIRSTILNEPEMFFAFNNGITATANNVLVENSNGTSMLKCLHDFQIVNGGQTTASLFHTQRKDKASLEGVFVQVKLSVVDQDKSEVVVPKISEYANTQNKVNAADFFSNHPYHVRMEEFSRRIWAPALDGSQRESKWFYERARGQYADAQSKLTPAEKRRFEAEYPKKKMFTKTDLAKYENVWDEHPKYVNLGAQKNFAKYAARIGSEWISCSDDFNEVYYKRSIARAIIFKKTEQLVSAQDWYNGGYRANIVAYTLALLSSYCQHFKLSVDYMGIWKHQTVSDAFVDAIKYVSKEVNDEITSPPVGISNVTEWCKKDGCWEKLRARIFELESQLPIAFKKELVALNSFKKEQKAAKKTQKIDNGIALQSEVLKISSECWTHLKEWCFKRKLISDKEIGVLCTAMQIPKKIPTEKQSAVLMDIVEKAQQEGWKPTA